MLWCVACAKLLVVYLYLCLCWAVVLVFFYDLLCALNVHHSGVQGSKVNHSWGYRSLTISARVFSGTTLFHMCFRMKVYESVYSFMAIVYIWNLRLSP